MLRCMFLCSKGSPIRYSLPSKLESLNIYAVASKCYSLTTSPIKSNEFPRNKNKKTGTEDASWKIIKSIQYTRMEKKG